MSADRKQQYDSAYDPPSKKSAIAGFLSALFAMLLAAAIGALLAALMGL